MTIRPPFALAAALLLLATGSLAAETVTLRFMPSHGGISPHELAAELGYYDDDGILLEDVGYASGGPASLFALASRSADIGSAATSAVINSIAGGNDFVAAYPSNGINDDVQSTFYVLDDSPIRTVADIAGATIAVNTLGAHLDYTVREALHQSGLPADATNLVVVPGPQLEQTLRSRQVDIAGLGYWQATFEGQLLKGGGVRAVFDDTDVLGEIAGGFIVLRRDFVADHPEAARAFVVEAQRAADWARENPDQAKELLAKILERRGENPDLAQFWTGFGLRPGAAATARDVDFWINVFEREGTIPAGRFTAADILYDPSGTVAAN